MQGDTSRRNGRGDARYDQQARAVDDGYVDRGLVRRDEVRRLRLADGVPHELGGRRPVRDNPDGRRHAALAAREHLKAVGLYGIVSDRLLRDTA